MSTKTNADNSSQILRTLINNSPLAMVLVDRSGIIKQVSHRVLSTFGITEEYVINQTLHGLLQRFADTCLEPDPERLYQKIPIRGSHLSLHLKHGKKINIVYYIQKLDCLDFKESMYLLIFEDRTVQIDEKERLTLKKALLCMIDSVTVVYSNGEIVFANWLPESYVGKSYINAIYQGRKFDDDGNYLSLLVKVLDTKEDVVDQIVDSSLTNRTEKATIRCLYDSNGVFLGVVSVSTDVTEFKKLQDQLVHLENISNLGELMKAVVHEVKNPLASISALAQLGSFIPDTERKTNALKRIIKEINNLNGYLDELSSLGTTDREQLVLTNPEVLIREVLGLLQGELIINNITLELNLCSPPPDLYLAPGMFKQALVNVVKNAIQAMHNEGKLQLQSEVVDAYYRLHIIDTGEGIPVTKLKNACSPFFSTKESGKGLGLAIATQIIHKTHHGTLEISSNLGVGTKVTFEIPLNAHNWKENKQNKLATFSHTP